MGEKRVNVKITADTSKFDKAMKNAQKELEKLIKIVDDLGDSKFGKELEKQFETVIDVTKKLEEQLEGLQESLDDISKTKLNKLDKELDDANDSVEDLNETLEDTQENLDDLGKTKLNKLEQQFEDITDTSEDLEKSIEDLIDSVQKLDKEDFNNIENGLKDVSDAGEKIDKEIKDLLDSLNKLDNNDLDNLNKDFDKIDNSLSDVTKEVKNFTNELKDIDTQSFDKLSKEIDETTRDIKELTNIQEEFNRELGETSGIDSLFDSDDFKDISKRIDKLSNKFGDVSKNLDFGGKNSMLSNLSEGLITGATAGKVMEKSFDGVAESMQDVAKSFSKVSDDIKDANKEFLTGAQAVEKYRRELKEANDIASNGEWATMPDKPAYYFENLAKELDNLNKESKEYTNTLDKLQKRLRDLRNDAGYYQDLGDTESLEEIKKEINKITAALDELEENYEYLPYAINNFREECERLNVTMEEQVSIYDNIRNEVIKYINTHKKAVMNNKDLAESFMKLYDSVKDISDEFKPLPDGMFERIIKEAKELQESFDLISTEELMGRLKHISKSIEQATEAQKKYNLTMKEGYSSNEAAQKIIERMKDMDTFASQMTVSVRKTADGFEYFADRVLEANKALDPKRLDEYVDALNEYVHLIRESGGDFSKMFAGDTGQFDPKKYLEYFEKFGKPTEQIKMYLERQRTQILENIKAEKEHAATMKENAKEALKQAKAELEKAEALEDSEEKTKAIIEAQEKLQKAEKDLADAKEKAKTIDAERIENAKKLIQKFNEEAEALRKLGASIKDITKADLNDGSLGTLLDDIFPNDLPKRLADFKEDFKAIFKDLENFDFGGAFEGLKNIGAGILDKIPGKAKLAAAALLAVGTAMKECAEIGINQFSRGMDTIGGALSKLAGFARDVGQEIRDAFENLTGMNLDFSSLIELPVDFESQMAKVAAIAGVTGDAFEELENKARELGATTRYSALEVGEAMEYMGMAGWDNKEIMAGLESVLNLATVSGMDLGQASDFVTDALTALGMEAGQAAEMVDMLAAVSTSSNTTVAQMQRAFTNCAPVAGTLGITMKDLSIALGLMADKGVKGAKAGTAMKNLMANLSAPTEKQLAYIKKFNLEAAQQDIVNGRLLDGIKKFKAALSGLTPQQQNAIITTIAGKEALSGISALLGTTEEDLAELEAALNGCNGAAEEMAGKFDDTLKGALLGLSSAMQETLLQIFDKIQDSLKNTIKEITGFFNILNGMGQPKGYENFKGLADAMEYLRQISEGWGQAIADSIQKAMSKIDEFVNGGALDDFLQVGTNIINGLADGIDAAADDGTLYTAIEGAISRIATWCSENLDTIIDAGFKIVDAICEGIHENSDAIGDIIKQVMDMQTEIDRIVTKEKWTLIGENLGTFIAGGIGAKLKTFWAGLTGFLGGVQTNQVDISNPNLDLVGKNKVNLFSKEAWTLQSKKQGEDSGKALVDGVNKSLSENKVNTDAKASEIGKGISDNIVAKLETMDASALRDLNTELTNLQTTVQNTAASMGESFTLIRDYSRESFTGLTNIVRNQIVNCTNIFRNQFVNMANIVRNQMLNVSNIIRNQAVNWNNIIRNQVTNARNSLTSQMLSMAAVSRTQMVNISNIIRNQSVNWANIISNQAKNARDNLTRQFMSMAKVVATQMAKCLSSVKSYMSQIASATNKSMSMNFNVNRTISTINTTRTTSVPSMANALYAANAASVATVADSNNTSALASRAGSSVGGSIGISGFGANYSGRSTNKDNITLEIPLVLDGREVARSTAKYVNGELKTLNNRENRKRGVK